MSSVHQYDWYFTDIHSKIIPTESAVNTHTDKTCNVIDSLMTNGKSDKIKQEFLQAIAVPLILYGCPLELKWNPWRKS